MRRKKEPTTRSSDQTTFPGQPFDEADWIDWDHWQTVEELQNFMNGLGDGAHPPEDAFSDSANEAGHRDRIARQIHRHGLEIDG
jgi:hypothetical protein